MPEDRGAVLPAIQKEFDVRPIVSGNIQRHPVFRSYYNYDLPAQGCPMADAIHDRGFFIGNHHVDARPALERMAELL